MKIKSLESVQAALESLQLKLHLGKMELNDEFEHKKKDFREFLKEVEQKSIEFAQEENIDLNEIHISLKEVAEILDADFNFSYHEQENKPKRFTEALEKLDDKMDDFFSKTTEKLNPKKEELKKKWDEASSKFKFELTLQKLQEDFKEGSEDFDKWKGELKEDIDKLKVDFEEKKKVAGEKFEQFGDEMSKAFSHFKKAFGDL
jgi:uncharacterized UPF0160 family protein